MHNDLKRKRFPDIMPQQKNKKIILAFDMYKFIEKIIIIKIIYMNPPLNNASSFLKGQALTEKVLN